MREINDYDDARAEWYGKDIEQPDPDLVADERRQGKFDSEQDKNIRATRLMNVAAAMPTSPDLVADERAQIMWEEAIDVCDLSKLTRLMTGAKK